MLSSGGNVIIWEKMISSGANVIMVSSGANVIIWCYHVMLSSGMITHPFFIFPGNFTHSYFIMICGIGCELAAVYTGLSWTPSPRQLAEAKSNLSQLYLSRLSLDKPAKLNFFKAPPYAYAADELQKDILNSLSCCHFTEGFPLTAEKG
jgi:hypothetical protein